MSMAHRTDSGDLQTALKNAADLLRHDPRLAQEQVLEILKLYPDTLEAKRILAAAYRLQKMPRKGLDVLAPLLVGHGDSPGFLHEIAQCLGGVGRGDDAISALRRAITIDPKHAPSWQSLGHQLAVAGDQEGSRQAFERHFEISTRHPELVTAVKLMREGKLGQELRLSCPKRCAKVTRSVSEGNTRTSSLTNRVTNNPAKSLLTSGHFQFQQAIAHN